MRLNRNPLGGIDPEERRGTPSGAARAPARGPEDAANVGTVWRRTAEGQP
jgi:hypothetical protein